MFNNIGRSDKSENDGTATSNWQHSHYVIIDDDDLFGKTPPCDINDCDDETIESTFTTRRCVGSKNSYDGPLQPTTHGIRSGSHFRVAGDELMGFDTFRHSYGSILSTSISLLEKDFGVNNIPWDKPIIINDNNIDDNRWKNITQLFIQTFFLW